MLCWSTEIDSGSEANTGGPTLDQHLSPRTRCAISSSEGVGVDRAATRPFPNTLPSVAGRRRLCLLLLNRARPHATHGLNRVRALEGRSVQQFTAERRLGITAHDAGVPGAVVAQRFSKLTDAAQNAGALQWRTHHASKYLQVDSVPSSTVSRDGRWSTPARPRSGMSAALHTSTQEHNRDPRR